MAKRYEVTGACVTHIPVSTSQGVMLTTLYRGAMLPADVPADRVKHLLDSNLVKPVGGDEPEPAEGKTAVNSRSSKADLVAYGVAHGDDRAELEALTREELLDLYVRQQ
jgi:hypothetical protein